MESWPVFLPALPLGTVEGTAAENSAGATQKLPGGFSRAGWEDWYPVWKPENPSCVLTKPGFIRV